MTRQCQTLVVSQQEAQEEQRQGKAVPTAPKEEGAPLINMLITLQYADATEVVRSIDTQRTSLLSSRGSVRLDKRTNSLVLRDTAAALAAVNYWIAIWDVPLEQVLITAHIVNISRENLREVGVNWRYPGETAPEDARASVKMPVGGHFARIGLPLARLNGPDAGAGVDRARAGKQDGYSGQSASLYRPSANRQHQVRHANPVPDDKRPLQTSLNSVQRGGTVHGR